MPSDSIQSVNWITRGNSKTIRPSIASFFKEANRFGRKPHLFVYDSSANDQDFKALGASVSFRGSKWKADWVARINPILKNDGLDPTLLSFALNTESQISSDQLITTGANRNTCLLSQLNQNILMVDDDVFLSGMGSPSKDNKSEVTFDSSPHPFQTRYFLNRDDYEAFRNSKKNSELYFFSLHENILRARTLSQASIPVSVSGISGDSGTASPRSIFSLPDSELLELTSHENLVAASLENRLVHRQSERAIHSPHPLIMAPCIGLNNHLILPPFFPQGRNQDGSYAYLLKALLPYSLIGHVPASIEHAPTPTRTYSPDSLNDMNFRLNDLLILILIQFLKSPPRTDSSSYLAVGKFLIDYTTLTEKEFLEFSKQIYDEALNQRAQRIEQTIERNSNINTLGMKKWIKLAQTEIEVSKKQKLKPDFGIPRDTITIARTQHTLNQFGNLLIQWPKMREVINS